MRKPTITIGIPAFNEESNIGNLLRSVFSQKEQGYKIKEILVVSDCSTDKTVEIVKSFGDSRIKVMENRTRKGKQYGVNKIIHKFNNEILVFLDADIVLTSSYTLRDLVRPLIRNSQIGLVCGNRQAVVGNFIEEAIAGTLSAYEEISLSFKKGHNVYSCRGAILALSKSFAKTVRIPNKVLADDTYLYFWCLVMGYKFHYVKSAKVNYWLPGNLKDHISQNKRFISSSGQLRQIFGDFVDKEYQVSKWLFYKTLAKQFLKSPVHSGFIFVVNLYCKYLADKETVVEAAWHMVETTKGGTAYV